MVNDKNVLTDEIIKLLNGGTAHATFDDAIAGLPTQHRGQIPNGLPYSIWQLVEHIRIALWDMLEFSKDGNHQSPKWPDGYWVKDEAPENDEAWDKSLNQIKTNLAEMIDLVKTGDLFTQIPHGDGQTLLREALQAADHTAYHVAEIIIIRRLLGTWES
ncbi:DinB family protein [Mucilaginibacter aquatilis]|uniref:DinB family protein n=1 Tax=Mucilaginibacter aquatilis TaxID=1517760 RepID=A0A6I4IPG0_9SPHI|nr:DinB family protein [Mucilaginibacter aquatilis]MVN89933.1 DinB family protein [Mucilaginibacter aquatilis]